MATFSNRSRYLVSVARQPALERSFAHDARDDARAYARSLRAQGHAARLDQGDDRWLVRIRQKGYPAMNFYADSYERAEAEANRVEAPMICSSLNFFAFMLRSW